MTPIRDYALIGNCETAALIGPRGAIDWLCLPAFDAGSIFAALLDEEKGGRFELSPTEPFEVERRYREDSAIFETRFVTGQSVVRLTDFFVIARAAEARVYDFTHLHPTRKLVRLLEVESGGEIAMQLRVAARPDYARTVARWERRADGGFNSEQAAFFCNAPVEAHGDDLLGNFVVSAAQPVYAVLDYSDDPVWPDLAAIRKWLRVTSAFWREWNLFNAYGGPHAGLVRRSAVTLKLLTYAASGGFVAAPTTSLPEEPGGEANWDYRYCWLRDTALFIQTLFGLGYSGEATAFLDFATRKWREKNGETSSLPNEQSTVGVLYPVCEAPLVAETTLDHLSGHAGARPVRIGNRAEEQFQLDNYGHLLQSFFFFQETGGAIDAAKREMLARLTREVTACWRRADNGIWEVRETCQFTYGKVMSWVALERARTLLGDEDGALEKVCAEIRRDVLAKALRDENGAQILSAKMNDRLLDASSLLAFTTGFLEAEFARPTREAIEHELARGPLVYRTEGKPGREGAFLICSFWLINHLIREGELARAEEMLERIIALASPLGLFAEEIDPETGAFLGNFPQAFSQLGLIQSILTLHAAKTKRGFYALPDDEKFKRGVGATIGWRGALAGLLRAPRTARLFFASASKWRD
ncbi:MAG: glycoside hydrolase family 15 protein [Verrucomicrobiota bacterium]|nr:glycoside hydrolase family 15 protein [Verrucomicrobiota bacterium]